MQKVSRKWAALTHLSLGYVNYGLTLIQAIVLVPLYLSHIGEIQYGLWLATGGILGWLSFLDMGLSGITIQRIGRSLGAGDGASAGAYFGTGYYLHIITMLIAIILALPLVVFVIPLLEGVGSDLILIRHCFILAVVGFALSSIANTLIGVGQAAQKTLVPGILNVISTASGILAIWYGITKGWGLYAIPIGSVLRGILLNITLLPYSRRLVFKFGGKQRFSSAAFKDLIRLSPFTFLSKLGNGVVQNAEPLFLGLFLGPKIVVVYVITSRAALVLSGVVNRLTGSLFGPLSHISGENDLAKAQAAFFKSIGLIAVVATIAASFFALFNEGFVSVWVGDSKFGGRFLTIGFALVLAQGVVSNSLSYFLGANGDIAKPNVFIFIESVARVGVIALISNSGKIEYLPYYIFGTLFLLSISLVLRIRVLFPMSLLSLAVYSLCYLLLLVGIPTGAWLSSMIAISTWSEFLIFTGIAFGTLSALLISVIYPFRKRVFVL